MDEDGWGDGMDECSGMVESSVFGPHENDVERSGSIGHRNESCVGCKESDVDGSRRDVNAAVNVRTDLAHSLYQVAPLPRKKFAQPGRKLDFIPSTLLEKHDSDKGNEVEMIDDDKIELLVSLHMQHGLLTNLEIAFILAIRASTGPPRTSSLPSPHSFLHQHLRSY